MSKILQTAKNLLHHDKTAPKERRRSKGAEERKKGSPDNEEDTGSRMNSDVCVPQLGHHTGYAHEMPPSPLYGVSRCLLVFEKRRGLIEAHHPFVHGINRLPFEP